MNAERRLLERALAQLVDKAASRRVSLPGEANTSIEEALTSAGFLGVGTPEGSGGSGGTLEEAAVIVRVCAGMPDTAPIPIGGRLLLGNWLRHEIGMPVGPANEVVIATGDMRIERRDTKAYLVGRASRVAWAPGASEFLIIASDDTGTSHAVCVTRNPAETRLMVEADSVRGALSIGDVACSGLPVSKDSMHAMSPTQRPALEVRGALLAAVQIAGLLQGMEKLVRRYARDRHQFGRSIGEFQLVKQRLTLLAGEVGVVAAAADDAVAEVAARGETAAERHVRAAHLRARRAATVATLHAHQLHGAIGVTLEYPLHKFSTELWQWRDFGPAEVDAEIALGRLVLKNGADMFWSSMVD